MHVSGCPCFSDVNISQGSIVTPLRCGGIFYYHFAGHLLLSLLVKEFWQVFSSSWEWQQFGHNRHGPKIGGKLGPHVTQCSLGWGLPLYQVTSWSIQPFRHNRHGPKFGVELGPHLTQSCPGWGLPSYQVASESIQPFGHNKHGPKIGGCAPFFREGSWVPI